MIGLTTKKKKLGEFYTITRDIYGPRSKYTNQTKTKQGKLLITQDEVKDRWVEHFFERIL